MADIGSGVGKMLANGGGALSFRLLATALAVCTLSLVAYEGERMNNRLDEIDQTARDAAARVGVHAARLDTLTASDVALWAAMHADSVRIDDHEHRISIIEGSQERH